MIGYGNSMFLATHGILARTASGGGVDPDAQAFITASGITDATQQAAINTLVVDLKGYSIWSKMKALYPMVGGTASTHKFNLKNPLDTDAAFRLVFSGGWTHSSTGATPNGTNAYADTFLTPSTNLIDNNFNYSYYSRNTTALVTEIMGAWNTSNQQTQLVTNDPIGRLYGDAYGLSSRVFSSPPSFTGLLSYGRLSSTSLSLYRNGTNLTTNTSLVSGNIPNIKVFLSAINVSGTPILFTPLQCAFASIGDGLTDTEAANFYTAVQAFQTTLGRSIGTQTVSDADAQAFVTAANIQDQVEANAINNLVIGMKADGLWTKMKAVYPFVGGSSSTMKFNLKNPLDTDAAFRLVFNGGAIFSSNGYLPNGTNGYADTKLIANNTLSISSGHLSVYSRTNLSGGVDMGSVSTLGGTFEDSIFSRWTDNKFYANYGVQTYPNVANTDSRGLFITNRNSATNTTGYKNGSRVIDTAQTSGLSRNIMPIGAYNNNGTFQYYSNRQYAFASIGDGLTDTEATNLNSRVTTFQTALNRNV
jgi:hypothetical protein